MCDFIIIHSHFSLRYVKHDRFPQSTKRWEEKRKRGRQSEDSAKIFDIFWQWAWNCVFSAIHPSIHIISSNRNRYSISSWLSITYHYYKTKEHISVYIGNTNNCELKLGLCNCEYTFHFRFPFCFRYVPLFIHEILQIKIKREKTHYVRIRFTRHKKASNFNYERKRNKCFSRKRKRKRWKIGNDMRNWISNIQTNSLLNVLTSWEMNRKRQERKMSKRKYTHKIYICDSVTDRSNWI